MAARTLIALIALCIACRGRTVPQTDGASPKNGGGASAASCTLVSSVIPVSTVRDLDILFVIDNSHTMGSEQARLEEQFEILMQALNDLPGGFPNAHIGVISTDMGAGPYAGNCAPIGGDAGRLLHRAPVGSTCSPPGDAFIRIDNANNLLSGNIANVDTPNPGGAPGCQRLYSGTTPVPAPGDTAIDLCDIQAAFKCIAGLGTDGCGFEQPLEAARRALTCVDGGPCTNPDFMREDALLAIVFLGDEDDCSARDGTVFNPQQTMVSSELGAYNSYRCFEFGVTCDPAIDRSGTQTLYNCHSKTVEDVGGNLSNLKLFPIQEYDDFFSTLKSTGTLVMAAITGPYAPGDTVSTTVDASLTPQVGSSCSGPGTGDTAYPAIRIHELLRRFGANGVVLSDLNFGAGICASDFSPALNRLGDTIVRRLAGGCLGARLFHETAEGRAPIEHPAQADCTVTEIADAGSGNEWRTERNACVFAETPIACPDGPPALSSDSSLPCWYVCDAGKPIDGGCKHRWQMRFCRDQACDPLVPAPANTEAHVQCAACDPDTCFAGCP